MSMNEAAEVLAAVADPEPAIEQSHAGVEGL
jgi:hypothetical protein